MRQLTQAVQLGSIAPLEPENTADLLTPSRLVKKTLTLGKFGNNMINVRGFYRFLQ